MTPIPRTAPARSSSIRRVAALLLASGLAGCAIDGGPLRVPGQTAATAPPAAPAGPQLVPPGSIPMPPGADYARARMLDEGKATSIYVEMLRFGDSTGRQVLFPPDMQSLAEFSPEGVRRLFTDTMLKSRRFEIFDMASSTSANKSRYVVDAQVIEASQVLRAAEGGLRVAHTKVTVSVQMKDVFENQQMFPTAVLVDGKTGDVSIGRTVFNRTEDVSSPQARRALAADYQLALRRAFAEATTKIESILRPLGRTMAVEGADIGVFGGYRNGYQQGDEMVVFRARIGRLGQRDIFSMTTPVALVACNGVGTETSQCRILQKVSGYEPQEGDYTVITDKSLYTKPRFD